MPGQNADEQEEDKRLQLLMEDHLNVEKRIISVETVVTQHDRRLAIVETDANYLKTIVSAMSASFTKLGDIQGVQAQKTAESDKKTALNEQAIVTIKERTDRFADHMETIFDRLVTKHDDTATKVAQQAIKWSVAQAIGLATLGILLTILAQHWLHL